MLPEQKTQIKLWQQHLREWKGQMQPQIGFWEKRHSMHHALFPQIDKDMQRTYPDSDFGWEDRQQLAAVLKKYALYFPTIGYTQGLNFVAGHIVRSGIKGAEAFAALVRLSLHEQILAVGLYQDGFSLNLFYCEVFWHALRLTQKKIYSKLRALQLRDQSWLFKWFISFFLFMFPYDVAKGLWDYVVCKPGVPLVRVALAVVKYLKQDIESSHITNQFDFYDLIVSLSDSVFCTQRMSAQKLCLYANTISDCTISKAIHLTTCVDNPYRIYFVASPSQQKQLWRNLITKFDNQRTAFLATHSSGYFNRTINSVEHLDRIVVNPSRMHLSERINRSRLRSSLLNFTIISQTFYRSKI